MSHEDPPRLLDEPSLSASERAALGSFEAPAPPYEPAIAARTSARVAALGVKSAAWTKIIAVSVLVAAAIPAARWLASPSTERTTAAPTRSSLTPPTSPSRATATHTQSASQSPAVPPATDRASPAPSESPQRAPSATPATNTRSRATSATPAPLERDLLADAQRSLEREHDAHRALDLIREHRRRFARSPLEEERSYLALRAYARLDDRGALTRAGEAFLRRFPQSIYAPAARRLVGASP